MTLINATKMYWLIQALSMSHRHPQSDWQRIKNPSLNEATFGTFDLFIQLEVALSVRTLKRIQ